MYVVTVEFEIKPEKLDDFRAQMIANARASREREPGCRQFDVCADPAKPALIFLYEVYDDRAAFDAHLASSHFREFAAATGAMVRQRSLLTWTRISG